MTLNGYSLAHMQLIHALACGDARSHLDNLSVELVPDDLTGLAERFASGRMKAADMIRVLGAGLRGAGNVFSDDDVPTNRFQKLPNVSGQSQQNSVSRIPETARLRRKVRNITCR